MSKLFPDERRARELPDLPGGSELKSSGHNVASVHGSLYSSPRQNRRTVVSVEVQPLDERIRQLCAKAAAADDSEVEAILAELQRMLREHNEFVRAMVSRTMNRVA
jgi:hypothetical protein